MKNALLFCFLWPSIVYGQAVRAQLTDFAPEKLGPYCGYLMHATALQFRLLDTKSPSQRGDTILVIIPCAREQGEALYVNGTEYVLTLSELTTEPQWRQHAWQMSSAYEQRAWPRWWCRGITRIK